MSYVKKTIWMHGSGEDKARAHACVTVRVTGANRDKGVKGHTCTQNLNTTVDKDSASSLASDSLDAYRMVLTRITTDDEG